MNEQLKQFLTFLYGFTFVPVYLYQDRRLAFSLPASAVSYAPTPAILQPFLDSPHVISFYLTDFGILYGCVKDEAHNSFCIVGPCPDMKYDKASLFSIHKGLGIGEEEREGFQKFLDNIPLKNHSEYLAFLRFLGYSLTLSVHTAHDLKATSDIPENDARKKYVSLQYYAKEFLAENNSLEIENQMLSIIENGDEEGLKQFIQSSYKVTSGTIAGSSLRNYKNIMIVSATLVCRAAIRGGMAPELAFHLSDSYIQTIESQNSIGGIDTLSLQMLQDFTHRVARAKETLNQDPILQKAIRYIQRNTNLPIQVGDVADHVGLSRGYLSTLFKKELGFDISHFVKRCKLEEARDLLRHSDKSLSHISSYLCFSSQSHFQNSFKKQYKITPLQYRRGVNEPSI